MDEYPLSKVYRLIEPGPTVLVTTANEGRANIMTLSCHMLMQFEPPLVGCVIGPWDHSFAALQATGECVIAIPTVDLAPKVVEIGNCSGERVDKFKTFALTPIPARQVRAPLIAECVANLECRVADGNLVNRYNLFVLEVIRAWTDPNREERRTIHHNGDGTFLVGGTTIDLKTQMTRWRALVD